MPLFITFIYKVGKNNKKYYGKYCTNYISDDHDGLDNEVKYALIMGLNAYKKQNVESKIAIGILSLSDDYSSENEIKCFDFYCGVDNKIYINGKLIRHQTKEK